jgi:hypothetical protein
MQGSAAIRQKRKSVPLPAAIAQGDRAIIIKEEEIATQAVKNHSTHQSRKRSHFGSGYRKTPPP